MISYGLIVVEQESKSGGQWNVHCVSRFLFVLGYFTHIFLTCIAYF